MARKCQISGKRTQVGNTISHSHRKTKRKFKVNLFKKRIYIPEEDRFVTLRISARMLKSLNKTGIKTLIKKYGQDLKVLEKK
ncbi:MAG: 50S ribosomal protein L28 [Leptospiraceae bacterium]|nr:50S ribosomal protein L28 [Leptospiraceae bacterium]MDW7975511.1 50S ribosomal protein L28 [Leptospiraceae bacterium]